MRPWHLALILVATVALVFSEVRRMDFVDWDDNINVYANPRLNPITGQSWAKAWTEPYYALYIPVTHTIWTAVALLARRPPDERGITLSPMPFHLANLTVHILNVLLVFAILRLLLRRDWPAFVGAGLFGLHPLQVEPVAWVTGMKDLAGALFALLALWQYLTGAAMHHRGTPGRPGLHMALAVAFFALAVLAKQTVVGLVVIAWALDHLVIGRSAAQAARSLLVWLPVVIGGAVIAKVFNGPDPEAVELWARPFVAGDRLAFYLARLVWPAGLCTSYLRKPALVLANWWGYVTWLAPAALTAALIAVRRRWPVLSASGLVFGVALLPVLGLVPFPDQDVTDRYMYLAMLGPALAVGWLLVRWESPRVNAAAVLLLAVMGFASSFQALHWYNTDSLFQRVLVVNPRSWVAHTSLANTLLNRGGADEAYQHLRQALRVKPDYADAWDAMGRYLAMTGRPEEAVDAYHRVLAIHPDAVATHHALGMALEAAGRPEEARAELEEAIRLDPQAWYAYSDLGTLVAEQGDVEGSLAHFRECIRIKPDFAPAYLNLASSLMRLGREDEARQVIASLEARQAQAGGGSTAP